MVKIKELLQKSLCLSFQETDPIMGEVRHAIKIAINKLEKLDKKEIKKNKNHTQWWDQVKEGTKNLSGYTAESHMKTLKQINDMIKKQEQTLESMEQKPEELLNG